MNKLSKPQILFIIICAAFIIASVAYFIAKSETEEIREEKYAYLEAIANLKIDQITKWRNERLSEASFFPSVGRVIKSTVYLTENINDKTSEEYLEQTLRPIQLSHSYENIFITDTKCRILFSLDDDFNEIDSIVSSSIAIAIEQDTTLFLDFYKCSLHSEIHLDIVSPIKDNNGKPIGAFVQRVNPVTFLYPLIQKWPTPTKTAESLIFRNEGSHVRLLSNVKTKNNSAMSLTIPITNTEYVAIKGAMGQTGVLEGLDYRGVKVLASIKKVPGTSWFLVSKVEQDEIYADIFYKSGSIALLSIACFLLFGTLMSFFYKQKQSTTYKNLFLKEKELAETREEFRIALYSIGDAVITTDNLGHIKRMNIVAEKLTGWSENEAKSKNLEKVFRIVTEVTKEKVENPVKRVLREGTIVGLANHTILISKDGKEIPIADSGSPIRDNENKIIGVILVFRDQTEERTKEKELLESNEKFLKIFQHSSDSISLTELSTGKLFELNDGFEKMFGYSRSEAVGKTTLELNLWADPKERTEIVNQLKQNGNIKNYEAIGTKKEGVQITVLISGEILKFNEIQYILFTIKDITERKLFEKNIRESEERFRKAFITSPDSIVINRISDGEYISVNQGFNAITGYTSDEVIGKNSVDIDIWETIKDRELFYNLLKETGYVKNHEAKFRIKDGSIRVGSLSAAIIELNGEPNIISITRDITEQKKFEIALKASEEKFSKVFYISPVSININRLSDGAYVLVNKSFCDGSGFTEEDVIGKTTVEKNVWVNLVDRERFLLLLKQNGSVQNFETQFRVKSGEIRDDLISSTIIEINSEPHILSIITDVTDRKKAEEEIRLSETNLKNSQRVARVGHYDLNILTGLWNCSEMLDNIFGIDQSYLHNVEGWGNLIYQDDKQMMMDHLLNDVVRDKKEFNKEYRIVRCDDKTVRWVYGLGNIEVDQNNNSIRMFGTIQDITDRKKAEEEILKTKIHYQKLIENAPDGIVQITLDGKFKYVSPSAKRIFGHPLNQRVEQSPNDLTHPEDLPFVLKTIGQVVQNSSLVPIIEYRFKNYGGQWIWIESTFTNLLNEPSVEAIVINFRDISYRKKAEKDLLEKFKLEEQIIKIAKTAPGGLCSFKLDTNGIISMPFVSETWSELLELKQEDVLENASAIFTKIFPLDVDHVNKTIKQSADTMTDWYDEFRIVNQARGIIWVEGHSTPSKETDGSILWFGFISDITKRKNAEEKLRTLSRAIEQNPAIIVITDTNGNIEFVNPKFTEISGYTFDEAKGKTPRILKSGHTTQQEYKIIWKTISDKNEWRGEFLNRKKNGELYWESAYISPILNENGEITNYIALKEDITERKKLIADLVEAKEKAEEMNRVKAYFFANMSHELRTPFVGIVGFSELLSESLQNPEEKEMADQILKSSKRLTDTLNKILNVTRLEFDKLEIKLREIDVIDLIDQLKILFSKSASAKNISIKTNIYQDEIYVKTDGRMLDEIITNLLNNAVKYTQDGFIEISAETYSRENNNYLLLKVSDTGVGIPKNKQEIIWKEFRQVSEGMNRSFEGTGLGLTIIKKYIDTLGGTIRLESEMAKGSIFTIELPVEILNKKDVNKPKEIIMNPVQNNVELKSRKPKILYVEDDAIALSYVDKVLKAFYEIDTAFNATIALELANKNNYEVMLLDINLGKGIDGVELMQMMRKIYLYEKIPIVAVTAYAAESDRLEFLAKGFTHYLSKPFTSVELRSMLNKIFN